MNRYCGCKNEGACYNGLEGILCKFKEMVEGRLKDWTSAPQGLRLIIDNDKEKDSE